MEVGVIRRQFLQRFRRHAAVKLMRLGERFVEERLRAEDGKIRQTGPTQQHAVGPAERERVADRVLQVRQRDVFVGRSMLCVNICDWKPAKVVKLPIVMRFVQSMKCR